MEHRNGNTHHEKVDERKHPSLIDFREAKKAGEDGREAKAPPKPTKQKSLLSIFLDQRKQKKQEPVSQAMGEI